MGITDREISQAYSDLNEIHGGLREDYFGLLYLEREFKIPREKALNQVAFGGNDYGLDGFHLDPDRKNLYLFQFKWSASYLSFKPSFKRLTDAGVERIFGNTTQDGKINPLLVQLKAQLLNDSELVKKVFFYFVFKGNSEDASRSTVLDAQREFLEGKKYLIDEYFQRPISMVVEFRSSQTGRPVILINQQETYKYELKMGDILKRQKLEGELMYIGFVSLFDLHRMYLGMKQRLFERNIRAGLSEDEAPNRSIRRSLKEIVLDKEEPASVFAFNHNGVTIFAEHFEENDGVFEITEPRLLNGAQTVTTYGKFIDANKGNPKLEENGKILKELQVLCKVITQADPLFVVSVTINNNRQNPVMPWNLRANDMIQLEIQDKFRDDLGIYYERQEKMFENLTDEDLDNLNIEGNKAVELLKLTKTFLVSDGLLPRIANIKQVFESDKTYEQVFNQSRLKADSRKIILCYKIQFRLNKLVRAIRDRGAAKYEFMGRARNLLWALLCQAVLNEKDLERYSEEYGQNLVIETHYMDWLSALATNKARLLIANQIKVKPFAENVAEENYSFFKTQAFFKKCMENAYDKWGWVQKKLK